MCPRPSTPSKRQVALVKARVAGYHNDTADFTRLRVESRVSIEYLQEEWRRGQRMRAGGVRCHCSDCRKPETIQQEGH